MALIEQNARLRAPSRFAHWFRKLVISRKSWPSRPRLLSDHLARDIGLTPHEIERMRLQLPSQTRADL